MLRLASEKMILIWFKDISQRTILMAILELHGKKYEPFLPLPRSSYRNSLEGYIGKTVMMLMCGLLSLKIYV
jgi:hypothetical protein